MTLDVSTHQVNSQSSPDQYHLTWRWNRLVSGSYYSVNVNERLNEPGVSVLTATVNIVEQAERERQKGGNLSCSSAFASGGGRCYWKAGKM